MIQTLVFIVGCLAPLVVFMWSFKVERDLQAEARRKARESYDQSWKQR